MIITGGLPSECSTQTVVLTITTTSSSNCDDSTRSCAEILVRPCKTEEEPVLSSSEKPSVRFHDEVDVFYREDAVLRIEEIRARWYQFEDQRRVRKDLDDTVALLLLLLVHHQGSSAPLLLNESTQCMRGLEGFTDPKTTAQSRRLVVSSVLMEQDIQLYQGVTDRELIAIASRDFSLPHLEKAHLLGLQDQLL